MKTVNKLWFTGERIYIENVKGEVLSQPMRFFPKLNKATEEQRSKWAESPFGLHWDNLNEDISFESFTWSDDDPLTLCYQY